jgi:hypothetical protein
MSVGGEGGGGAAPAAIQTKGQVIHVGKDGDGMDHGCKCEAAAGLQMG